jgi:putative ABC transport system substrate-binding protein
MVPSQEPFRGTSLAVRRTDREGLQPDIVVTNGTPETIALQRQTRTIPIVFANVGDPIASGIVPRLNQPSGNITGFALYESLSGRQVA